MNYFKFAIFIFLTVASSLFWFEKNQGHKCYLKEETMLRYLKKEPFLTKEPAPWMLEQIERDFQGIDEISLSDIDHTFSQIKHLGADIVRYRIVNNELYRYFDGTPIPGEDNSTEKAIKTILQRAELPNTDFIISFFDAYPLSISHHEFKAPLLVSAKLKNAPLGILIPDWRSIGHWWMSDIKAVQKAAIPWEKKRPFALWRGGLTKAVRYTLCKLSITHPDLIDARFSSDPEEPNLREQIERDGLKGKRASWEELLGCKYLPYVDGVMCAAPALQWRLLSGSLTFKPDSDEIQWFYGALKPNVHYVPVKGNLSDLVEKIEWAKAHDEECRSIAEEAFHFANENLRYSDVLNYLFFVLKRYGSCQNIDSKEMKGDPRWVKIQFRKAL